MERDRGELRVGADRPDQDDLAGAVHAALLEDVCAHHQVRVPVAAGVGAVRADASDLGGQVDDELGPGVREQPLDVGRDRQVVVAPARHERLHAVRAEALDQVRAQEARATRDQDAHPQRVSRDCYGAVSVRRGLL